MPLLGDKGVARFIAKVVLILAARSLAEVGTDGAFATVSEGRVSQVVGQAGCTDDAAHLGQMGFGEFGMAFQQLAADVVAQAAPHAAHLQRVGQAVVYEDASRQGEHLGLVLQSAEGGRENESVEIALELRAVVFAMRGFFLPEAFIAE